MKGPLRTLAFLLLMAIAGCGSGQDRPLNETILVIAVLGNFSGETKTANEMSRSVEIALGQYNRHEDSTYRVRLNKADTKGTPEGAIEAARSLVGTELLVGVVGPFNVSEVLAAGQVLNEAVIPFLVPNLSDVSIEGAGWTSFRRLVANDRQEGAQLGRVAARSASERITVLFDSTPNGAAAAEGARAAIEESKKPLARFERVSDVRAIAEATIAEQVGAVVFGGSSELAGQLVAALRERDYEGIFFSSHQAREAAFLQVAGSHAAGTLSICVCSDGSGTDVRDFADIYRERFKSSPPPFALETYDGAWMLLEAIEEVDPKPREVVDFFHTSRDFLGYAKRYSFDERGELVDPPVWMKEFRDGRWQALGSKRLAGVSE